MRATRNLERQRVHSASTRANGVYSVEQMATFASSSTARIHTFAGKISCEGSGSLTKQDRDEAAFIRLRGISKSFPGVQVLDDVSLTLNRGEISALTGENGSGKSTLAKILMGLYQPEAGAIEIDGKTVVLKGPADAASNGIVAVSQELTLAPELTVAENICLGRLPRTRLGAVDWARCRVIAREALARLRLTIDEQAIVGSLPIELRQAVEIARALSRSASLLILDEATSSLSEAVTDRLLTVVEEMRDEGAAILMITHRMPELYRSAARATVLRDGQVVDTVALPETPESTLVRLMVGREMSGYYGARTSVPGGVVMRVRGLDTDEGALGGASFDLRRGEILGIAGLVGSGKAELAQAIAGAVSSTGSIEIRGKQLRDRSPRGALAAGIGYVPDDRKGAAILPRRSIAENFAVGWLQKISRYGFMCIREERRRISAASAEYGVRAASNAVPIALLSGGNQQKVVLGRTFSRAECDVFVLHEPTRGIDVAAKSELYGLMRAKVDGGGAVVMVSSELPELLGVAHRILVFHRGEIAAEFMADEVDEETVAAVAVSGAGLWAEAAEDKVPALARLNDNASPDLRSKP